MPPAANLRLKALRIPVVEKELKVSPDEAMRVFCGRLGIGNLEYEVLSSR